MNGLLQSVFSWLSRLASRKSSDKKTPTPEPIRIDTPLNLGRAILMLRNEEGVKHQPYQDHLGYWTIGVGHLIDERKGGSLPEWAQAELDLTGRLSDASVDKLLEDDIIKVVNQLEDKIWWSVNLDPVRYAVLLDMAFQMGINGLLGFKNTLAMIENDDYDRAADGMLNSLWARQTPKRARRRSQEMRTGVFHDYK